MLPSERPLASRILLAIVRGALTVLILLDEIARPLYRPLASWFASLGIVARMEAAIARLPRFGILLLLAIPFAIAEPAKLGSLILIARGQVTIGIVMLAFAHLFSFIVVERIYDAGRDKLLTYGWLNWIMTLLAQLRDRALGWVRSSSVYLSVMALRDEARRWWRSHLHR